MGISSVIGRSIVKALKQTGITLVVVGGTAVGTAMGNPELMAPIWAATGPVAAIALFLLSVGGQALVDAIRHRDKA